MSVTSAEVAPISVSELHCHHCGGHHWTLEYAKHSDKTLLLVRCGNQACIDALKEQFGIEEDLLISFAEYDVTGQEEVDPPTLTNQINTGRRPPKSNLN